MCNLIFHLLMTFFMKKYLLYTQKKCNITFTSNIYYINYGLYVKSEQEQLENWQLSPNRTDCKLSR